MVSGTSSLAPVSTSTKAVSERVIDAVASVDGVDPVDLSPPIFQFVDAEALDALATAATDGTTLAISFEAWGHDVTVTDETVHVDGEPVE